KLDIGRERGRRTARNGISLHRERRAVVLAVDRKHDAVLPWQHQGPDRRARCAAEYAGLAPDRGSGRSRVPKIPNKAVSSARGCQGIGWRRVVIGKIGGGIKAGLS